MILGTEMEITIRRATAGDYLGVCELLDEVDALHRDRNPRIFGKPASPARTMDFYLSLLADEKVGLFLAETAGRPVGLVHVLVRDMPDFPIFVPRRYAIIDTIVVRSGYRNGGIGGKLMQVSEAWAIASGASSIELGVYEFNETAISFYESLGFHTLSRKMKKVLTKDA